MTTRKPLVLVSGLFEELQTPADKLDFAGNTTTDLAEGTNLYYTDALARASISVTDAGGDGSLTYDNTTGVITYNGPTGADVRSYFSVATGSGLTYNSSTGEFGTNAIPNAQLANSSFTLGGTAVNLGDTKTSLAGFTSLEATTFNSLPSGAANNVQITGGNVVFEGATGLNGFTTSLSVVDPTAVNTITFPDASGTVTLLTSLSASNTGSGYGSLTYNNTTGAFSFSVVTDANIRGAISVTDSGGDGSLAYDNSTGIITYTGPSASEVRAHFSVATGSGLTYNSTTGEFGTSNIPNSQLQNSSITVGSTAIALGSSATTITGLTSLTSSAVVTNDNGFRVRNSVDATKQVAFNLASVATATTRTLTVPDLDGTILLDTSTLPSDFDDSLFRVSDNGDSTKKLAFECSGITTSTTRTMTVPDENGTIATQDFATAIAVALG
jgi:hypothetical protein